MFPIWTVVLIIILVSIAIATVYYIIKHRRPTTSSPPQPKKPIEPIQTTIPDEKPTTTPPPAHLPDPLPPTNPPKPDTKIGHTPQNFQEPASDNESEAQQNDLPPEPPKEIRISLPLPPPTTSFFSDKMELQDQDLFGFYLDEPKTTSQKNFFDIRSHLQKAATLKSTLRQSLKPNERTSLSQLFPQEDSSKVIIDMNARPSFETVKTEDNYKKQFQSIRGLKGMSGLLGKSGEQHLTLTSGSIRRFMRESNPVEGLEEMMNRKGSRKSGGVIEMNGWWDQGEGSKVSVELGTDKRHSNPYHAQINPSIGSFQGTISKGTAVSTILEPKEESESNHGSLRKGTLGRSTLRSITASATQGVNRSLKGLFDYSSTASLNKIVPDDSQKMELDSECSEEKSKRISVNAFGSIHKKSIRAKQSSYPTLPSTFMSDESSTKYAVSDDDSHSVIERMSKKSMESMIQSQHQKNSSISSLGQFTHHDPTQEESSSQFHMDSTPVSPILDHRSTVTSVGSLQSCIPPGEVDSIRRMLQDTWNKNLKESSSSYSIVSDTDSVLTTSTQQSTATITQSKPKLQSQFLNQKSRMTQKKPIFTPNDESEEEYFIPERGPEPTASFSSSTVRTVIPAHEPIKIRKNGINRKQSNLSVSSSVIHGSNKIQENEDQSCHYSTSPVSDFISSPHPSNSTSSSSKNHSRKSSGGNSTGTALRVGINYSDNAKTWNGRAMKKKSITRSPILIDSEEGLLSPNESIKIKNKSTEQNERSFYSTMRKGQKTRGNIPWMSIQQEETSEKTPAQIERDKYLKGEF